MTLEQKIDFMIYSLQIAKEELYYAKKFKDIENKEIKQGTHTWDYSSKLYGKRNPNATLIKENINCVARLARVITSEIKYDFLNKL